MKHEQVLVFPEEGRHNMKPCIVEAFTRSAAEGIDHIVIFSGTGEGPVFALQDLLSSQEYAHFKVTAVTPPVGRRYRLTPGNKESLTIEAGIQPSIREFLINGGVDVISAHLPFKQVGRPTGPVPDMLDVGEALSIISGGFPLCVQAALIACDAGAVAIGERITVASADTAIIVWATRTENFLSKSDGLIIDRIICKPLSLSVSKRDHTSIKAPRQSTSSLPAISESNALSTSSETASGTHPDVQIGVKNDDKGEE